jgi:hypothetical protein
MTAALGNTSSRPVSPGQRDPRTAFEPWYGAGRRLHRPSFYGFVFDAPFTSVKFRPGAGGSILKEKPSDDPRYDSLPHE